MSFVGSDSDWTECHTCVLRWEGVWAMESGLVHRHRFPNHSMESAALWKPAPRGVD